jgi:signal transduction histidine kinase
MNNQKSQFFSIISHDLRGPTRNTNMLLEMMGDSRYASTPEESKNMAKMAMESAKQTQKLVEDLLTWSRLQMDQVEITPTRFRPYEAADKVCQALQATALLKDIVLENSVPFYLFMQADMNMIETVIRNLVSNAIKFTPTGGRICIKAQRSGQFIELVVEDSGVGMTQEVMGKIFSFHTKHATKGTAGEPGTGLGLVLCQEFVERNRGSIAVDSQVGKGSKFKIQLPAAELAAHA